jgi:hypothetical protein
MTEGAARLVDEVLPRVRVRQWVLSLPYRLRYVLAWDHGLCRAVLAIYARVLLGLLPSSRTSGGDRPATRAAIALYRCGVRILLLRRPAMPKAGPELRWPYQVARPTPDWTCAPCRATPAATQARRQAGARKRLATLATVAPQTSQARLGQPSAAR